MDKKNVKSRQNSNKVLSTENRKLDSSKQSCLNNGRRRENYNSSSSKAEFQRKSGSQKPNANIDKRPKPRGFISFGNNNNKCNKSDNSVSFEPTSTSSTRLNEKQNDISNKHSNEGLAENKKQNLNHLINFHYASRDSDVNGYQNTYGHSSDSRNRVIKCYRKHQYDKRQFLQANFQFVINCDAQKNLDASSPDVLVDWSFIEQINIKTTEEPRCPICLYPPVAAKLTRCGHVYCWPCILHYLALSEKTWSKCPICFEAIHIDDLKSVMIVQQQNFTVHDIIQLQLMKRQRGGIIIEKVEDCLHHDENNGQNNNNDNNNQLFPHLSAATDKTLFAKFLLANYDEILSIIEREKVELLGLKEDCPEFIFHQQALDLLEQRKLLIYKKLTENKKNITESKVHNELQEMLSDANDDYVLKHNNEEVLKNSKEKCDKASNESKNLSKFYYFYQSVDGQNIFLHPLNVKMLKVMYGSLSEAPLIIEAQILQKDIQSMSESLRKKFSCLSHLPLTCEFVTVEIKLEPPTVSEDVFKIFKGDIVERQNFRALKAKEEQKRERKINDILEREMGVLIARSADIDIKSFHQFPTFKHIDNSLPSTSAAFDVNDSLFLPESELKSSSNSTQQTKINNTSFANILSTTKNDFWPTLSGSCAKSSPSLVNSANVWCNDKFSFSSNPTTASIKPNFHNKAIDSENNGLNVEAKPNLGDFITGALWNTKNSELNIQNGDATVTKNKKGKNKKKSRK